MPRVTPDIWASFLTHFPNVHILQTVNWGQLKEEFGWSTAFVISGDNLANDNSSLEDHKSYPTACGAQILFRQLPLGLSLAYIPRGPVGGNWKRLWPEVDILCKEKHSIFLKVEPDFWGDDTGSQEKEHLPAGFRLSPHSIQPIRTLVVDLQGSEDQILARMKQKTRYNIRLAQRKGVVIRQTSDVDIFFRLMKDTGERDVFNIHSKAYYQRVLDLFDPGGKCVLLCAEYERQPLAGVMVFAHGNRAWYFYGASSSQHRHLMPTYLLQWKAMLWAREQGCKEYDLWGVPDENIEILESNFLDNKDGLWGVYRFKRGFGGELRRSAQTWDRVYNPLLYKLYQWRTR